MPFDSITADQIRSFLGDLSTPRAPNGAAKPPVKGLSNKTILNVHTALSALWTWAVAEGIVTQHLLRQIPRPKPEKRAITPFSKEDIKTLLAFQRQTLPHLHAARQARLRPRRSHCAAQPASARVRHHPAPARHRRARLASCPKGSLKIKDADLTNKRILVLGKGTLCEELRAADLPAHGEDVVALPDDRAEG